MLADRSLVLLSSERLFQDLTKTNADKVNHWTEPENSNGRVKGSAVGVEEDCNPTGRTTVSTNQIPQSFQGLSHQPNNLYGPVHDSTTYVAENCLIWYQWEGRHLVLWRLDAPEKRDASG